MEFAPKAQTIPLTSDQPLDILKYKYALENSNIGVWEWNMQTDQVFHSRESQIIFGYERAEMGLAETNWTNLIHPDDLQNLQHLIDLHIEKVTEEYRSEHRILCKNGSYKWVLDCGKIVEYDADNNPIRFIGTTIDITKRKEDEAHLHQNINIISEQNKKLRNFAHIVTHNLKEHSANFESLLAFYNESSNEQDKHDLIAHITTVSKSLSHTIDSLRDIVAKQQNKKIEIKPLNFNDYVNKVKDLLEMEIRDKDAQIINKVSDDLILYSNDAYLESIILNLASNALKYSHPDRAPIITIDSLIRNDDIQITLTDNGIGIDLEKYGSTLFGLYKTFHGNENAEGIGLYMTKNQIEALGGIIDVQSTVNKGTTFTVTIKASKN